MSKYEFPQTSQHKDVVEIAPEELADTMKSLLGGWAVKLEQAHFVLLEDMSPDYKGGQWKAYTNHKSVFFMVPPEGSYRIRVDGNGFDEVIGEQAAGLVVSIVAINKLLWHTYDKQHDKMFKALRRYAQNHKDSAVIMSAID
jgi:hypothetical protein